MEKEYLRYMGCVRKRAYPTEKSARKAKARMENRTDYDGLPINVYPCEFCGEYHIGHAKR